MAGIKKTRFYPFYLLWQTVSLVSQMSVNILIWWNSDCLQNQNQGKSMTSLNDEKSKLLTEGERTQPQNAGIDIPNSIFKRNIVILFHLSHNPAAMASEWPERRDRREYGISGSF